MRRGDGDDKEGLGWEMVGKWVEGWLTDPENGRLRKMLASILAKSKQQPRQESLF